MNAMEKTDSRYSEYIQILKEELLPAMGCTEPIAIAYAAAKAAEVLGTRPERLLVEVSGNMQPAPPQATPGQSSRSSLTLPLSR